MKKINIFLICFLLAVNVTAQDTIPNITFTVGVPKLGFGDQGSIIWISYDSNRTITIDGDTMVIIRMLLKRIEESDSTNTALWDIVGRGIDFSNEIPEYWKVNNCKWPAYLKRLRKAGFGYGPMKKKKQPCK